LIESEDGTVSGILLEHNHCAEHEWGVKDLHRRMNGMTEADIDRNKVCDMSRIQVKVNPEDLIVFEEKGLFYLAVDPGIKYMGTNFDEKFLKLHKLKVGDPKQKAHGAMMVSFPEKITKKNADHPFVLNNQTISAWDGGSFGITTRDPKFITFLKELQAALLSGDAVLHISGTNNPFKPVSGLVLAILSKIPQEQKDQFKAGHEDLFKLKDAAAKTGIEQKLKAAGKTWFALSPSWITIKERIEGQDENGKAIVKPVSSKYPVMFWLNPMQQHIHNSMWCMVEDLEAWIKNEGPIMKKQRVEA
jgi:hypothetical protein